MAPIFKHFRKIRIVLSLTIFAALLLHFLDVNIQALGQVSEFLLRLQVFPSIIRFFALFFTISSLGFLLAFLLAFFFGRIYCSSICPLGTFQDILIRIASLFKKKKNRKFLYSGNKKRLIRYGILTATLILWISGSLFLVNLLDPYSNFGKIVVSLFQPLYIGINNSLAIIFESQGNYLITPMMVKTLPMNVLIVSSIILLTIIVMTSLRGRLFCNTLCPVGSMLGLISARSRYQITFNETSCNLCGQCERVCKAECINSKTKEVDQSRCINCFNCFSACKNQALSYTHIHKKHQSITGKPGESNGMDSEKRKFLLYFSTALISIPWLNKLAHARQDDSQAGMIPTETKHPITPPGSIGYKHFTNNCIACYLCVSACPTNVIVPSFFDYGLEGFMQPKLDFHKSFCNFDCVKCTEVCPTGAITKQTTDSKQEIQMGIARFMAESCIVTVDRTDCGACSEHCPTKAVQMVPFEDGLFIPAVNDEICVGCGACEFACPTQPYKAIYVESNTTHQSALRIEEGTGPKETDTDDFPF